MTISGSNGSYQVQGTHLYAEEGSYNFSLIVSGDGNTATIAGSATVADCRPSRRGR